VGLFSNLLSKVRGGGAQGGLVSELTSMIGGGGSNGLGQLVQSLTDGGLGQEVKSWVSTGANLPVTPAQITQALGNKLGPLAQKVGISPAQVASGLSSVLPSVVDKLTPNGQVPSGSQLHDALSKLTKH
jgi:uncharacterized protein YidB (DUF937 family)